MKFEWDEVNARVILRKHGIDFVGSEVIFDGVTKTVIDDRKDYGEDRFVTFGLLEGRVVAVTHTETTETIRIISIRKATQHEQALFFQGLEN
jgi:uncharacterized DUF497 family protein